MIKRFFKAIYSYLCLPIKTYKLIQYNNELIEELMKSNVKLRKTVEKAVVKVEIKEPINQPEVSLADVLRAKNASKKDLVRSINTEPYVNSYNSFNDIESLTKYLKSLNITELQALCHVVAKTQIGIVTSMSSVGTINILTSIASKRFKKIEPAFQFQPPRTNPILLPDATKSKLGLIDGKYYYKANIDGDCVELCHYKSGSDHIYIGSGTCTECQSNTAYSDKESWVKCNDINLAVRRK